MEIKKEIIKEKIQNLENVEFCHSGSSTFIGRRALSIQRKRNGGNFQVKDFRLGKN